MNRKGGMRLCLSERFPDSFVIFSALKLSGEMSSTATLLSSDSSPWRTSAEALHLVLVLAQARLRQDHRLLHARRVQPVLLHTAQPRIADHPLMPRRRLRPHPVCGHLHHGGDVLVRVVVCMAPWLVSEVKAGRRKALRLRISVGWCR